MMNIEVSEKILKNGSTILEAINYGGHRVARLKMEDVSLEPTIYIVQLSVNKKWRREKIGTQLLSYIELVIAKRYGQESISLFVFSQNEIAIQFYRSLGFFISMTKKNKLGSKFYLMTKQI